MPELPEVETVTNSIKKHLINHSFDSLIALWPKTLHNFSITNFNNNIKNKKIINIYRRGKFIVFDFDDCIMAVHLRMTGKLYISKKSTYPKYARAVLEFDDNESLIFEDVRKFGRIYLYDDLKIIDSRHGPEPLDKDFTVGLFKGMIKSRNRNSEYVNLKKVWKLLKY